MEMSSGRIMPISFVHTSFNFSVRKLSGASSSPGGPADVRVVVLPLGTSAQNALGAYI